VISKISRIFFILILLTGCAAEATPLPPTQQAFDPGNFLYAQVTFEVDAPAPIAAGQSLVINLLDEITGLELNPARYQLNPKENNRYSFQIPVPVGSVLKYRYSREGTSPSPEYTSAGKPVRYRLLQVVGPVVVSDIISGWSDLPFRGQSGRLIGQVLDTHTQAPVPNMMISAGGTQTLSAADGTYLIEGLPAGIHNLVAYSLDGAYQPFQQGAQVAADLTTPTPIRLMPAQLVSVTFTTQAPPDSARGIPIRIIGNILSLGNTFADLTGGVSTLAARAPLMTLTPDGRYTLTLSLPAGLDLRYKYSAGDGFWNAEHISDGSFQVRQLIVPGQDVTITDTITSWQTKDFAPVTFTTTVPANTPATDTISIQFNLSTWTEPIPMWPLGNRQWLFVLYSPIQLAPKIGYRFCRNDQCDAADDESTAGRDLPGKTFIPGPNPQNLQDEVKKWARIPDEGQSTTVVSAEIRPRGSSFYAGVELAPNYRPSWQPYISWGFEHTRQMGANWVILDPTWTTIRATPPLIEPVPGKDPYWQDLIQMVVWAQDKDLSIALFPGLHYEPALTPEQWWSDAQPDAAWWQAWFERYRSFILHHADLASQVNAGLLILGDPTITPASPNSKLPTGAEQQWRSLITEVRSRYRGKIGWALPFSDKSIVPGFIGEVDEIYLLWSLPLTQSATAQVTELATEMGKVLDGKVLQLKEKFNKPLILGISYPSVSGAARGCAMINNQCVPLDSLTDQLRSQLVPDLSEQAMLYNAVMIAINQRPWIGGVISRGFYPPTVLQDATASINGKPAGDVLWYWYPKLLAGGQ
jgi:hypothetical protein